VARSNSAHKTRCDPARGIPASKERHKGLVTELGKRERAVVIAETNCRRRKEDFAKMMNPQGPQRAREWNKTVYSQTRVWSARRRTSKRRRRESIDPWSRQSGSVPTLLSLFSDGYFQLPRPFHQPTIIGHARQRRGVDGIKNVYNPRLRSSIIVTSMAQGTGNLVGVVLGGPQAAGSARMPFMGGKPLLVGKFEKKGSEKRTVVAIANAILGRRPTRQKSRGRNSA